MPGLLVLLLHVGVPGVYNPADQFFGNVVPVDRRFQELVKEPFVLQQPRPIRRKLVHCPVIQTEQKDRPYRVQPLGYKDLGTQVYAAAPVETDLVGVIVEVNVLEVVVLFDVRLRLGQQPADESPAVLGDIEAACVLGKRDQVFVLKPWHAGQRGSAGVRVERRQVVLELVHKVQDGQPSQPINQFIPALPEALGDGVLQCGVLLGNPQVEAREGGHGGQGAHEGRPYIIASARGFTGRGRQGQVGGRGVCEVEIVAAAG